MFTEPRRSRRQLLSWAVGLAQVSVGVSAGPGLAVAASLIPTPAQSAGPFYPETLPLDADNDLVRVKQQAQAADGEIAHLFGRVRDLSGKTLTGCRVEIWQCDSKGFYHHSGDRGGQADPNFQGYGQAVTDGEGRYRFRTLKPVPYPGRTPHIHVAVSGPGIDRPLVTQLYLKDHPLNVQDFLFNRLPAGPARDSVLVDFQPAPKVEADALAGEADLVMGYNVAAG